MIAQAIEHAARDALRRAGRLRPVAGYTRDEALQDARIGAWHALDAELSPGFDRAALMALAGYRNILDARGSRWKRSAGGDRENELIEAVDHGTPPLAPSLIAVEQTLRAIERLRAPLPEIARLLIEGYEAGEIAAHLGVSPTRIAQHRRTLQSTVSQLLEVSQ